MRFGFLLLLILSLVFRANAQNAPVTTAHTITYPGSGPATVPISVTGFNNIGAVSLSLDYDYSVIHYLNSVSNPVLGFISVVDSDLGNGIHRLTMGWFGSGKSLSDGAVLVTINFTYISGSSPLTWFDDGTSCEYADGNYNTLNDIPSANYYINGYVCGIVPSPGTIFGDDAVCQGEQSVNYYVQPVPGAMTYYWAIPSGAIISNGSGTNSVFIDFNTATSGSVSVQAAGICSVSSVSTKLVTVNLKPIPDAGPDFSISYGSSTNLSGSPGISGTFNYHWKPENLLVNPYIQNPQTINLTNTNVFRMIVANATTSCSDSDEVIVNITGGPLSVNPFAYPEHICVPAIAQLFANPGGGSGNYTYSWTSVPSGWTSNQADPFVIPEVTTEYSVTVNDGFTNQTGTVTLEVTPLPTAVISGSDTLCGNEDTAEILIDLTGTPPWTFTYTNGIVTTTVSDQMTSSFMFTTNSPGTWTIISVSDFYCEGMPSGEAVIAKYPVPPAPVITLTDGFLNSGNCCGNQWYLDGMPVPGATEQGFFPEITGTYYDIVTLFSCPSAPSNSFYVVVNGENDFAVPSFSIFPNPCSDYLFVINPEKFDVSGGIYNIDGRLVKEFTVFHGKNNLRIDEISAGYYVVRIGTSRVSLIKY